MENINREYCENIHIIKTSQNTREIEKSIKRLVNLRNYILTSYPEYIESIIDIDYRLACAAYRINKIDLFEQCVQKHYYGDYRFKKLYQLYREVETTNIWNNIVKENATRLERTFVRSISLIIITTICLSLAFRK